MKKTLATLLLTVVLLLGLGIVLLASASILQAQKHYNGDSYAFFLLQAKWLFVAIAVGAACCWFDYHNWKKYLPLSAIFYIFITVLLLLTLIPPLRNEINGSYRWLNLKPLHIPLSFQPGEFAKLAIVIMTAVWMNSVGWRVRQFWRGAVAPAALIGMLAMLLLLEKDFGALLVVGVLGGSLMFVAGTRLLYLACFAAPGAALLIWKVIEDPHRFSRVSDWWQVVVRNDVTNVGEAAHHLIQSMLAFKMGGLWGSGFNQSMQKQIYLPEIHTDFILAAGGEELGFFFSLTVLLCYIVLLICGIMISTRAPDRLGRLLAFGMILLLAFQGMFNIAVVTGLVPTKGIALPFISYGGTNLITALFAVGTLYNIGLHVDVHDERMHTDVVRDAVNTI